ncbi:MAG: hypothetical protein AB1744_13440, partial [Candidatus Zixiibacteriota bacterium]
LKTLGYSAFGNLRMPGTDNRLSLFGRFDYFDIDADDVIADKTAYTMVIAGASYALHKGNLVMLVFESTDYERNSAGKGKVPSVNKNLGSEQKVQAVYQIKF